MSLISNIGTLFSGIDTIGLVILNIWELISFTRWRKEKALEKKSEIASVLIYELSAFEDEILELLKFVHFVYDRSSESNCKSIDNSSSKEQQSLISDPFEIRNYLKSMSKLKAWLRKLNIEGEILDRGISSHVENLKRYLVRKEKSLTVFLSFLESEQRIKAYDELNLSDKSSLQNSVYSIREILNKHRLFT